MKPSLKLFFLFFIILLVGFGCRETPEWPEKPELLSFAYTKFDKTNYKYHEAIKDPITGAKNKCCSDSIILSVNFQDGDANLGLEDDEVTHPYNPFDTLFDANGKFIEKEYALKFNIYDHTVIETDTTSDTILIKVNKFSNNLLVDFIEYDLLDNVKDTLDFKTFIEGGIKNFDGRFLPLYKKDYSNKVYEGPLEGTINYTMTSVRFPKGIWRFRVRIVDRDLNVSNAIISPKITIE